MTEEQPPVRKESTRAGAAGAPSPASLMRRFGLEWPALVAIVVVSSLIWLAVWKRGNEAYGGLLGRPLRVGIVPWPGYAGGLVANNGLSPNKDSTYWKSHNLYVEFVVTEDAEDLKRGFALGGERGGLDVIWSTVDSLALQAPEFAKEGIRAQAVMQVDWSRGGDAIVARAGIEQVEGLKGKKIAVSMAASQWLLEYSLENSSMTDVDKTQIRQSLRVNTPGGSPEARELFVNNKVDAAVLWEPDVKKARELRRGAHVLVDTGAAPNLIADVMVGREEFIQQHHDVIDAFIRGWLDGTTAAINDPMLAVKVLRDEPKLGFDGLTEEETRELLGKTALATLGDNASMFGLSDGDVFFDQLFTRASGIWLKDGYITAQTAAEQARDSSFLKEIYDGQQRDAAGGSGCRQSSDTIELAIEFAADGAELGPDVDRVFRERSIPLLLRTNSEYGFCVEAVANRADDPRRVQETKRAREDAVIKYLVQNYKRPPGQFVSVSADEPAGANGGRHRQYIRLRLAAADRAQ